MPVTMQHEVAAAYHGCWKCKKLYYPYYFGSDDLVDALKAEREKIADEIAEKAKEWQDSPQAFFSWTTVYIEQLRGGS